MDDKNTHNFKIGETVEYNCEKIHIPLNRFNIYFKYIFKHKPEQIKYVSEYNSTLDKSILNLLLIPFTTSKVILTINSIDITFILEYKEVTNINIIHICYLIVDYSKANFDFYKNIVELILTFLPPINKDENPNAIYYSCNNPFNNWSSFEIKEVPTFNDLIYPNNLVQECLFTIDNYLKSKQRCKQFHIKWKCNILIEGELGTGKLSFIQAMANHYSRRLYDYTISSKTTSQVFQENIESVKNGSILAIRGFELIEQNIDLVNYFIHFLESFETHNRDIIIFLVCYSSKSIFNSILRFGKIDYIIKLESSKKSEMKQLFFKMCSNATDNLFKEFYNQIVSKKYLTSISSLSHYLCYYGETAQLAIDNLDKHFIIQDTLRKDISKQENDKFYT
jgi:hypothetical protein